MSKRRVVLLSVGIMLASIVSARFGAAQSRPVIFVNVQATGLNDGTSWENAYDSLQDALATATGPAEIWVAAGTYYPDRGATVTENSVVEKFEMKSDVALFGGFTGTETERGQRNPDPETNDTVLCGNIDDDPGDAIFYNSFRVVEVKNVNNVVIDGFTVRDGGRPGFSDSSDGVGITIEAALAIYLINLRILDNFGRRNTGVDIVGPNTTVTMDQVVVSGNEEDGVAVRNADLTMIESTVSENTGRGVFVAAAATVLILNSLILKNAGPGAVVASTGELKVQGSLFEGNDNTGGSGGGISNGGSLSAVKSGFVKNKAANGAGLYMSPNSAGVVVGNNFLENEATGSGGAIANYAASLDFDGNYVMDNTASTGAGITNGGVLNAMNDIVARNAATTGAGFYGISGGVATWRNSTFVFNQSTASGGGIHARTGTKMTLFNGIVSGNSAPTGSQFSLEPSSAVDVGHTAVEGGIAGAIVDLGGNIDHGTQFVDATQDDFTPTGPSVDGGNNNYLPNDEHDIDGDQDTGELYPVAAAPFQILSPVRYMRDWVPDSFPFDYLALHVVHPVCVGTNAHFTIQYAPTYLSGTIDYGDGSAPDNRQGFLTSTHVYAEEDTYVAELEASLDSTTFSKGITNAFVQVTSECEGPRIISGTGKTSAADVVDMGAIEAPGTSVSNERVFATDPAFVLGAASPNPARETTTLVATLRDPAPIRIEVYDMLGRRVQTLFHDIMPAGQHLVPVARRSLPAGQYVVRAVGPGVRTVRLVMFVD